MWQFHFTAAVPLQYYKWPIKILNLESSHGPLYTAGPPEFTWVSMPLLRACEWVRRWSRIAGPEEHKFEPKNNDRCGTCQTSGFKALVWFPHAHRTASLSRVPQHFARPPRTRLPKQGVPLAVGCNRQSLAVRADNLRGPGQPILSRLWLLSLAPHAPESCLSYLSGGMHLLKYGLPTKFVSCRLYVLMWPHRGKHISQSLFSYQKHMGGKQTENIQFFEVALFNTLAQKGIQKIMNLYGVLGKYYLKFTQD